MRTNLEQWSLIATGAPPEEIDVTAQGKIVDAWEKQPVLLDRDTMMKLPPELRPAPAHIECGTVSQRGGVGGPCRVGGLGTGNDRTFERNQWRDAALEHSKCAL